jgi:hypothetical protein
MNSGGNYCFLGCNMISKLVRLFRLDKIRGILTVALTLATLFTAIAFTDYLGELPLWARIFLFPFFLVDRIYWGNLSDFYSSNLSWLLAPAIIWYITTSIIFSLYEALRKKSLAEKKKSQLIKNPG